MSTNTIRNATLTDLVAILRDQQGRKVDVVAPATAIKSFDGVLRVTGTEPVLSAEGVTTGDGHYVPTVVADEGIAAKLNIPVGYLKGLRAQGRGDLYDANVNGWLHGKRRIPASGFRSETREIEVIHPHDARSFLLRCFRGDDGQPGVARAFLSDKYAPIDNLDVLMATLQGMTDAGVKTEIRSADLTDRRMVVNVACPQVSALAPELLAGYRSPFTGQYGSDNPVVFAGFQIANSEVGNGAYSITPRIEVQICKNGMVMSKEALTKVHMGARLDAGVVRWGEDTQKTATDLITKQTRDAVRTFLSEEYLNGAVARLTEKATERVDSHETVRTLTKGLRYTDDQIDGILTQFTQGGQMTLGGVVNAITAYSQTVQDGDAAYDLDARATSLLV